MVTIDNMAFGSYCSPVTYSRQPEESEGASTKRTSSPEYVLFALVLAGLVWLFFALPPLGLCSNDEGAKFVQMKNFVLHHRLAIEFPAQKLGFGVQHVLGDQRMFAERMGRMYCTYPPLFPFLSSLLYPLLGNRVTHFLPLLSFFLSLILLSRILRQLRTSVLMRYSMLFAFLVGSPVLMYSITFWEHLPGVLMAMCSLYFVVRCFGADGARGVGDLPAPARTQSGRRASLFLSAFCLGAGALFRTEMLFLVAAYMVALGVNAARSEGSGGERWKKLWPAAAGAAIPLLGNVVFNSANYRHPWLHIAYNSSGFRLSGWFAALPAAALLGAVALFAVGRKYRLGPAVRADFLGFVAILWLWFVVALLGKSPVAGLFLLFPVTFLVLYGRGNRQIEESGDRGLKEPTVSSNPQVGSVVFWTTVAFLSLTSYFMYKNPDVSVRYCLAIVPFVIVYVAAEEKRIFSAKPVWVLLAGFLLASTGFGLRGLKNDVWRFVKNNAQRVEFLKQHTASGDVVVFEHNRLMEHAGPLFFERVYLVARDSSQLAEIEDRLRSRGVATYYYWTSDPGFRPTGGASLARYDFEMPGINCFYLFKVGIELESVEPPGLRTSSEPRSTGAVNSSGQEGREK
ncbi:MAG: hypothetical protein NTX53_21935 [candidate division WOR-3 bacterium]|nr:hypothetical protein [candidate division WOR-3 bacterium]